MDISSTAAWDKIWVSAREARGINSFPSIETGAFSAQLHTLKASSERRCSATWALFPSQMRLPAPVAKAMD